MVSEAGQIGAGEYGQRRAVAALRDVVGWYVFGFAEPAAGRG